jgi:formate dehydrogenase subunit beta
VHLFGENLQTGIAVEMEADLAARLGLEAGDNGEAAGRSATVEKVIARRRQVRDKELSDIRAKMSSNGGIAGLFDACIRCHNCMTACPICYCKTCLFRTAAFDHPPEHYLTAARRKGATRLPGDTLLFHMTRMNHMSASCVSCGMCTSACPSDIPVGAIFSAVGEQVQAAFEYVPGRSLEEPLPLITFQANEWTEVGEAR